MRQFISVIAVALLAACADGKYLCSDDTACPPGTTCECPPDDAKCGQKYCAIPGGCDHICSSNEKCQDKQCKAQSCPVCNANEVCDTTTFQCHHVTSGFATVITPAAGGVIGGPSTNVVARAGGPNGVTRVDFVLKTSTGTTISTGSAATGDAQGIYTATLNLGSATTSTGATLVATTIWPDSTGAAQQSPST